LLVIHQPPQTNISRDISQVKLSAEKSAPASPNVTAPAAGGHPPLGRNTDTVGHSPPNAEISLSQRKNDAFTTAKELLPNEGRLQACLCLWLKPDRPPCFEYAENVDRVRVSGLVTCGSPWLCPNCGGIVAEQKALELREDIRAWGLAGHTAAFAVHTLQHFQGEALVKVWDRLKGAYKKMWDGRPGRRFRERWHIVGRRRGPDSTWTIRNGWHPHFNTFYFLERDPLTEAEQAQFRAELSQLWQAACDVAGGYADDEHGLVCRFGDLDSAVDYVASKACGYGSKRPTEWGAVEESTKSAHKEAKTGGYNPNQLLEMATWGNEWAADLWREYALCFKGKKFLDTTPGLRSLLDELKEQFRDELDELAGPEDEKPEYKQVFYPGPEAWKEIWRLELFFWLKAELKAAKGDAQTIKDFLAEENITQVWFPSLEPDYPDWWILPDPLPPDENAAELAEKIREFNQFANDWNSGKI